MDEKRHNPEIVKPVITVSIVLHRTSHRLVSQVLESLSREPVSKVYVIDNSPDASLSSEVERYPFCEYIHTENRGYGAAHNIGIRHAADREKSDFHLVLNPDVRWSEPVLMSLANRMMDDESIGLVQPRIVYPDGRLQHTSRLLPTPWDVFGKRFLPGFMFRKRLKRYLLPDEAYEAPFNSVYLQGSFMFFRMESLQEIGLFDERFFMYPEDIDITRRIRKQYKAMYMPENTIIHDHAAQSARFNRLLWVHIVNMIRYFNKWGWFKDQERRELNRQLLREIKEQG